MTEDRRRNTRKDREVWTQTKREAYREHLMQPGPIMTGMNMAAPWDDTSRKDK
jgi:hypothetical protein